MRFTMNRDALLHAAQVASKVAARADTVELACVRIDASGGTAAFSATDGDRAVGHSDMAMVDEDGAALVPAKALAGMVKSLPDGAVTVGASGRSAEVAGGRSRFVLPALDPRDWQGARRPVDGPSCAIDAAALLTMAKRIAPFCAKDDARAAINGVHVSFDGSELRMEGTNSYKIGMCSQPAEGAEPFECVVAPDFLVGAAEAMCGKAEIAVDGARVALRCESTEMTARLIAADFPDVGRFASGGASWEAEMDAGSLARALGRVQQVGNVRTGMQSSGGALTLSADAPGVGSYSEEMPCDADFEFWGDVRFLKACVDAVDSPSVTVSGSSPVKPVKFEGGSVTALAMPMRPPAGDAE